MSTIKGRIGLHLALLFLFAMGITAFFALTLVHQMMVKKEVKRALYLAHTVAEMDLFLERTPDLQGMGGILGALVDTSAISLVEISLPDDELRYGFGTPLAGRRVKVALHRAMATGEAIMDKGSVSLLHGLEGATIVALPLNGPARGAVAVVVATEAVRGWLAEPVKLILFYILINLCLLTVAGVHQISKVTLKPVTRLLAKAENLGSQEPFFLGGEVGSEFSRLSLALNTLISRINEDRERLKASVSQLEGANQELKRAQEEVIRAEKLAAMGRLASGVAHEIGNPLGVITGYLSLIGTSEIPEERADFIRRTEEEVGRIDGIIRELLDLNRGTLSGERSVVRVHALVGELRELIRVQPLLKGIDVAMTLAAGEDAIVATHGELRQVFVNLILNAADAIKSVDRSGIITILTRNIQIPGAPSRLEVVVADNGAGMSAETLPFIFDPFFSTKEPGQGTGLGLWVSFRIVEGLGGRLTAESHPGEGTRMIFQFPLAVPSEEGGCEEPYTV